MSFFGKRRITKPAAATGHSEKCGTAAHMNDAKPARTGGASVKILGMGCAKCNALEVATRAALAQLSMDPAIDHVTDPSQIAAFGVMTTPALVIDGKVVSFGKILKTADVVKLLQKTRGAGA